MNWTRGLVGVALSALIAGPSLADGVWEDLRAEIYGDVVPVLAPQVVELESPYRTYDDPRTEIGARIVAPVGEFVTEVSLIIDENPMPVSAVFELAEPMRAFEFTGTMRINGPTMVRVVAETDRGKFYMQEAFVKTSGVGACAAPPGTDPEIALQTLGTMNFKLLPELGETILATLEKTPNQSDVTPYRRLAELEIDHPSHSGMQMDQITLLFIPSRFVDEVAVRADEKPLFKMRGSISLSENPAIRFEVPEQAVGIGVTMTDTEGARFEETFTLPGG